MKKYPRIHRCCFAGALISVLISTLFAVTLQFFKGDVLDYAVAGQLRQTVRYTLLLAVFILLEVLSYFCYKRFSARFATGCVKNLKQDIFESILKRGYVAYTQRPQGEYLAKYTNQADAIQARRFNLLPMFWEILFKIILVSAALFVLDWRVATVTIALMTTPLYIPKMIDKKLQTAQREYLRAMEDNLAKVNDWLSGFEIIKNYSIEAKILDRFRSVNDRSMEKLLRDTELGAVSQLITTLISYLSYFFVLACAAGLVLKGEFSAGDFFVAIGMIDQLSYPLISLAEIVRQLIAIKPACAEMEAFVNAPPDKALPQRELKAFQRDIRFIDVSFAYGQRPLFSGLNLTIPKGTKCLFKGPSGCGKTTAVNLLLRYYPVSGGRIEIDGVPLHKAGAAYGCMTVVRQDAILFHDTLRNNLAMYRDIPGQRLIQALESVGLGRFANAQALEGIVTENGANFSGGEKKRICLARALLRDTDVLILDEPLANLDAPTAERIEDLLLSIPNKTVLVVSHQFTQAKLSRFDQVVDFAAV